MKSARKPRRHQKLTAGRTKVSRRARYIRRKFFATQIEVEFLKTMDVKGFSVEKLNEARTELSRAEKRLATIEEQFKKLPKLARRLEVPQAVADAELDGEDEGEE